MKTTRIALVLVLVALCLTMIGACSSASSDSPGQSFNFTMDGYFDSYLKEGGEYGAPAISFFEESNGQFDGIITAYVPCTGEVLGDVVSMTCQVPDSGQISGTGSVQSESIVVFEDMGMKFERMTPEFGTMQISPLLETETDRAIGGKQAIRTEYKLVFDFLADNLSGGSVFTVLRLLMRAPTISANSRQSGPRSVLEQAMALNVMVSSPSTQMATPEPFSSNRLPPGPIT